MSELEHGGAGGRAVERAAGERNGVAAGRGAPVGVPDPELVEVPRRRRFSAEYKLRIVREAEACTSRGEIGELLRREGLYSSLLTEWRRARDGGALAGLERPRGPKANPLEAELWKARRVIEVQGNVSALLEQLLGTEGASEPGSTER
jgi:transposase-like protein